MPSYSVNYKARCKNARPKLWEQHVVESANGFPHNVLNPIMVPSVLLPDMVQWFSNHPQIGSWSDIGLKTSIYCIPLWCSLHDAFIILKTLSTSGCTSTNNQKIKTLSPMTIHHDLHVRWGPILSQSSGLKSLNSINRYWVYHMTLQ